MMMRKIIELIPFALLIVGTFGLLLNEFVFDWGTRATLAFALANVTGLIALCLSRKSQIRDR